MQIFDSYDIDFYKCVFTHDSNYEAEIKVYYIHSNRSIEIFTIRINFNPANKYPTLNVIYYPSPAMYCGLYKLNINAHPREPIKGEFVSHCRPDILAQTVLRFEINDKKYYFYIFQKKLEIHDAFGVDGSLRKCLRHDEVFYLANKIKRLGMLSKLRKALGLIRPEKELQNHPLKRL